MPYCFPSSSIIFQGHKISPIFTRIERFQTVTPVWIHRWIWNDAQSLTWYRRSPLLFSRPSIKFQGHTGWKIDDLNPISVRLLDRSQLTNPSDLPCLYKNMPIHCSYHSFSSKHRFVRPSIYPFSLSGHFGGECTGKCSCIKGNSNEESASMSRFHASPVICNHFIDHEE